MIRYVNLTICLLVLLNVIFTACKPTGKSSGRHPNIIILITDDQGYGDIRAHGNPWIQTPNMDKLHAQSTRFTNFHVGTTCAPTRAGLMTGVHCNRAGVWHTIIGRSLLKKEFTTLPEILRHSGYRTGMFGKWHLGDNYPFRPQDRGFEKTVIHGGGGVGQSPDYWNNDYFDDTYFHNGKPVQHEGYCTDVWFKEARRFIDASKYQPFFCYISTNAPHSPYHVPQKYIDLYANNEAIPNPNFYGMITNIDENLGQLDKYLEQEGLRANTIFIFMTDNGTSAGVQLDKDGFVRQGFNAGMRGRKGSPYEGGHRVPFFIRWPNGEIEPGRDIGVLTHYTDIMPTLLDLCQIDPESDLDFHGKSLKPLMHEDQPDWAERTLITDTQRKEALTKGKDASVMTQRWRLVFGEELYDMQNDPGQTENVYDQYPQVVKQLQEDYEKWWTLVSRNADAYARITVGDEEEDPVTLVCHDVHPTRQGYPAWSQDWVRKARNTKGFWALDVASDGDYRIEARRWPREADATIRGSVPRGDPIPGGPPYPKGKALPLQMAYLKIDSLQISTPIVAEEKSVVFETHLAKGPVNLTQWYTDDDGNVHGGYYLYIKKLDE